MSPRPPPAEHAEEDEPAADREQRGGFGSRGPPELISKLSIVLPPIEKFVMGASVVAPKNVRVDDAERGVLE
jgi:hypothetical protein